MKVQTVMATILKLNFLVDNNKEINNILNLDTSLNHDEKKKNLGRFLFHGW